jgi:ATP-grasp domain
MAEHVLLSSTFPVENISILPLKESSLNDDVTAATNESQTVTTSSADDTDSVISGLSGEVIAEATPGIMVKKWDQTKHYSDLILEGLVATQRDTSNVVMLFESPSSSSHEASFFNGQGFKFHDYPPSAPVFRAVMAPCRYTMMNGSSFPSFLKTGSLPEGLLEHWKKYVPDFAEPSLVSEITENDTVYAYLPVEHIANHVNDPHVHYHMCGKDALHLMTKETPRRLNNTQDLRPCICKTTHSMGSKGIFVIRNDEDEMAFEKFLVETGNPTFVITEFVEIERNIACHFFVHPESKEITWIGSNENLRDESGTFSSDSVIKMCDQESLKQLQLPYVMDVAKYFKSHGFWGFAGVDVLFNKNGDGYLIDLNPRCTGSSPAIILANRLKDKYGFQQCLFRRSAKYAYPGTAENMFRDADEFNAENEGRIMIVISSFAELRPTCTLVQLGVYGGSSIDECREVLNRFTVLKKLCP